MPRKHIQYELENDYYILLGVTPHASVEEIQRAYRQRAKETHPDRNPDRREWATENFQRLNEAYAILADSTLRLEYDRQRRQKRNEGNLYNTYNTNDNPPKSRSSTAGAGFSEPKSYSTPPPHGQTFDFKWRGSFQPPPNPYMIAFKNIMRGPYRYVLIIIGLILTLNIVYLINPDGRQIIPISGNNSPSSNPVYFFTPVQIALPAPSPCMDSLSITSPAPEALVDFKRFSISGTANIETMTYYRLFLVSEKTGEQWFVNVNFASPKTNALLADNLVADNLIGGRFSLIVLAYLENGPPVACAISITRK
jgi:DnaJ domain